MYKAFQISILALSTLLTAPATAAEIDGKSITEAAGANNALAAEFQRIMKPIAPDAPWVERFGVTTTPEIEAVGGKVYDVYRGCKPNDCPAEVYVLLYDRENNKFVSGAFVRSQFKDLTLTDSTITWLGDTDTVRAGAIGKHLY